MRLGLDLTNKPRNGKKTDVEFVLNNIVDKFIVDVLSTNYNWNFDLEENPSHNNSDYKPESNNTDHSSDGNSCSSNSNTNNNTKANDRSDAHTSTTNKTGLSAPEDNLRDLVDMPENQHKLNWNNLLMEVLLT